MLEMCAFVVTKSKLPNKSECPICCLGLRCFFHCCGSSRADGSNKSITVSLKINAGIPSFRRLAPQEMISASVLLCETVVCLLHDHEIETKVRLPNMHNTPPDVDLETYFVSNTTMLSVISSMVTAD